MQSVAQKSERIADEETKCQHMADLAQNDLNEALPALQEAISVGAFWICEILFSFIFFFISLILWHSTFQRFGIMVFSTSHMLKTF